MAFHVEHTKKRTHNQLIFADRESVTNCYYPNFQKRQSQASLPQRFASANASKAGSQLAVQSGAATSFNNAFSWASSCQPRAALQMILWCVGCLHLVRNGLDQSFQILHRDDAG